MHTQPPSTHTIAAGAICRGINHVLSREPWAMIKLGHHARKTMLVGLPFGHLCFEITSTGLMAACTAISSPSLSLDISAKALSELAGSSGNFREQAFKAVKISGDADLAQLLGQLIGQVRWEYEEDLSNFIGDAPANFAVRQGKKILSAGRSAASDLIGNVVEYVSEEKKVLLNKRDFMIQKSELNDLRDAVDRMEKRIHLLEHKQKAK